MSDKAAFHPYGVSIPTTNGDVILNAGPNMKILPQGNLITFSAQIPSITLKSGVYTPTLTNVANLTSSTAFTCQYMQVGNTVTVSGKVALRPTLNNTSTILGISLPITSKFTAAEQCGGTAAAPAIAVQCAAILADSVNSRAQLQYLSVDNSNQPFYFSFTYKAV